VRSVVEVKMGQKVQKGDVLATLDPTFTNPDQDELIAKLREDSAAFDRLQAESGG
jgi:hemolysin D